MPSSPQNDRGQERRRRGSALIEFALAGTFIFLPMLAGLATVGMSMVTAMQAANLNSSAGQLFSSGVDFTQATNQNILLMTAGTLNTSTSGGGVVILSEIEDDPVNGYVCVNQSTIPIGTGVPGGASKYVVGGQVTGSFAALMPMVPGQIAYLAETYYNNPQFAWAFAPAGTGTGIYVKAIF